MNRKFVKFIFLSKLNNNFLRNNEKILFIINKLKNVLKKEKFENIFIYIFKKLNSTLLKIFILKS